MIKRSGYLIPRFQKTIDVFSAAALSIAGVLMIVGYSEPGAITGTLQNAAAWVWASTLTVAAATASIGALLATETPGRQQSIAYACEMAGWGLTALCVIIFGVANTAVGGSAAGNAALFALGALLLNKYVRRLAAVQIARHEDRA